MENGITLRGIDVDRAVGARLFAEALGGQEATQGAKDKALASLGITRAQGERPLTAWLRVRAEENGRPVAVPAVSELRRASENTPGAMRFVFWLA